MAGLSSSLFRDRWSYDVFLSFRGDDTRKSFTSHLYATLREHGIHTFLDDEREASFEAAIEESKIFLVVFSKNYASSTWCLDELVKILECSKKGKLVLPIFYGVDPSDVRHQRGSYAEALAKHDERFRSDKGKVNKWRMALLQAAELSGFHFIHGMGFDYNLFISQIVKEVSKRIDLAPLHVADYPVGLEARVSEVVSILNLGSNDVVHTIGIYGCGGIGKTTLARALYSSINHQFDGMCFIENVAQNSLKYGLVNLQQMLYSKMTGDKNIKFGSIKEGISIIKHRLRRQKVLLVLDDINDIKQLQAVAGTRDWFSSGSVVIITTRDKGLLTNHKVEIIYEVKGLNHNEALELLSCNAFKSFIIDPSYTHILDRAVTCASGLPLALELIGSNLYGKSIDECQHALCKYQGISIDDISNILRVSYDSLEEEEKEVFLDIACFYGGYKLAEVEDILHAHRGSSAMFSIELLIEKSLIKIDSELVTLHDLIQEMGREIVRQESPKEPGKRSRLWFFEDVVQVLEKNTGTSEIEILSLEFPKERVNSKGPEGDEVKWDGDAFKYMKNLKTLIIRNGHFSKGPKHLPNSLRVLKWSGYPSPSLPKDFHPKKLAMLELPDSFLTKCEAVQNFECLTALNFDYCKSITSIPDLSGLPNIVQLSFKRCENLIQIHESVGFLKNLEILDAVSCTNLRALPPIRLISLKQLSLSHCRSLQSFPEILGKMENMTELRIMRTPIKKFPNSFQNLSRLRKLELEFCGMIQLPSSIVMMSELGMMHVSRCEGLWLSNQEKGEETVSSNAENLVLSYCNISNENLTMDLTWFTNVKNLNLSGNNFTKLHKWVKELCVLRNLNLDDCMLLREIQGIPPKLETLSAKGCTSLKDLDLTIHPAFPEEFHSLRELILDDCVYLPEIRGVVANLNNFSAKNCSFLTTWCTSVLLNQESVKAGNKLYFMPGTKIPEWFAHCRRGGRISFWFRNKFPAISLCLVIGLVDEQPVMVKFSPVVFVNGEKQSLASQEVFEFKIATEHILLFDLRLQTFKDNANLLFSDNEWNHVEVSCSDHITYGSVPINLVAKQIGIHVFKQTSIAENIQFTNPYHKRRRSDDFLSTVESRPQLRLKQVAEIGVSETELMQELDKEWLSLLQVHVMQNVILDPKSMERSCKRVKTKARRPGKTCNVALSLPILALTQPPLAEAEKGQASHPIPSSERTLGDVGGETSETIMEDEIDPTTLETDFANEKGYGSDDVDMSASFGKLESDKSSSNSKGSETGDPFEQVNAKLCVGGKHTISSGVSFGDASLTSIREAMDVLELLMAKDLSEVSSDPTLQSQLDHLLDLLNTSSHYKAAEMVKEAIVEFRTKALASLQEFEATVEPLNKLKNFEDQKARIQKDSSAGTMRWKDLTDSIRKVSSYIKAKNRRKKKLEMEIANLMKELQEIESDVKDQEASCSSYLESRRSLDEQAQALSKKADYLLAANRGVEEEGKAAEEKQNMLRSTWSTDLTCLFIKIKKMLDSYE